MIDAYWIGGIRVEQVNHKYDQKKHKCPICLKEVFCRCFGRFQKIPYPKIQLHNFQREQQI